MSKCYKAEDVIKCVAQYIMTDAKIDNSCVCGDIEDYIELTEAILADLPTIEVSEDCISREDAVNAIMAHFIPQTYTGDDVDQALKLARKIIDNAPSVVPSRAEGGWVVRANGNNECSICGKEKQDGWVNFCGFCGANMKG